MSPRESVAWPEVITCAGGRRLTSRVDGCPGVRAHGQRRYTEIPVPFGFCDQAGLDRKAMLPQPLSAECKRMSHHASNPLCNLAKHPVGAAFTPLPGYTEQIDT